MDKDLSLPPAPKRPIGEAKIWLTSIGLALGLIMIFGLLGIIVYNGLEAFWPKTAYAFTVQNEPEGEKTTIYGNITKDQTRHVLNAEGKQESIHEYQIFTGNKEKFGQAFRFIDVHRIVNQEELPRLMTLERLEGGKAIVDPIGIKLQNGSVLKATDSEFLSDFQRLTDEADHVRKSVHRIEKGDIGAINNKLDELQREVKIIERSYDIREVNGVSVATLKDNPIVDDIKNPIAELAKLKEQIGELHREYETYTAQVAKLREHEGKDILLYQLGNNDVHEMPIDQIVYGFMPNELGFFGKLGVFWHHFTGFILDDPREANTEGGIFPAIFGTFIMTVLMSMLVTPIGVIGAIYLREYAKQGPLVQSVRICVNNLAGVPSIVFGVFGLGFFVYYLGGSIDQLFYWKKLAVDNTPTFGTSGILWASLTLALMTLPVVIVSTEEALSAVPRGLREAALACGASKWQMIQRIILPCALPGVMTGLILAMARGAGEVAPLMVTGVVKLAPSLPIDGEGPFVHLERKFMHLGFHIYDVGFQSPDSDAAQPMVFATTLLLILLVVVMNLAAILIRNKLRKRYQASSF